MAFPIFAAVALKLKTRPVLGVALAMALVVGLNVGFQAVTGKYLTLATIAWGALRIVPCFALGCALYGYWKARPAQNSTKAVCGASIALAATIFFTGSGAPDFAIVLAMGLGLLFLAQLAQTRSAILTQAPFVYLGEISYSMYMICVPWKIVFVNAMTHVFELKNDQLTLGLWLVLILALIPLSAISYHLIEKPARERMKLISVGRPTHQSAQARA